MTGYVGFRFRVRVRAQGRVPKLRPNMSCSGCKKGSHEGSAVEAGQGFGLQTFGI